MTLILMKELSIIKKSILTLPVSTMATCMNCFTVSLDKEGYPDLNLI